MELDEAVPDSDDDAEEAAAMIMLDDREVNSEDDASDDDADMQWPEVDPETQAKYDAQIANVREHYADSQDMEDPAMVSEYADDIFEYMGELEVRPFFLLLLYNPLMSSRSLRPWPTLTTSKDSPRLPGMHTPVLAVASPHGRHREMRQTLVDWLLQVHMRYHMLPETLWIAVNIVDRFLTKRVVSLIKLQLVGVTAMFIAAKYEEVLAPSVEEFVYMTDKGYSREEILKGERIVLQTLEFRVSPYCSPYSWVRRISKADDYDIQTRTLSKFLMEVTLLDHRFLRARPSLIAAVGMYCARRMLGGNWDDAFVFYSGFTEQQLEQGHAYIVEKLAEPGFDSQYVYKKYANKRFLKASLFARDWAMREGPTLPA